MSKIGNSMAETIPTSLIDQKQNNLLKALLRRVPKIIRNWMTLRSAYSLVHVPLKSTCFRMSISTEQERGLQQLETPIWNPIDQGNIIVVSVAEEVTKRFQYGLDSLRGFC